MTDLVKLSEFEKNSLNISANHPNGNDQKTKLIKVSDILSVHKVWICSQLFI